MAPLIYNSFVTPCHKTIMAPLLYNSFVTPCHNSHSYLLQCRGPFYMELIKYHSKFVDKHNKASILNYKKEKPFFCKKSIKSMLTPHNDLNSYISENERDGTMFLQQHPPIASILSKYQSFMRFIKGILQMSRLEDYAPSMALVLSGGWIGGGHSMEALMRPGQVWIAAGCAGLITVTSMLVNDIFDFHSGTDQANGRTSPLLSGQIHPYHLGLVVGCLYVAFVIGLCYLETMSLRLLIGVAAITTYIYTPILKRLTIVKNMVVSGIVSSSIFAGALATGGKEQLQNPVVITIVLFLFLCILSRELLMDVRDMVGDKATGVNTLAVHFGGQIGTITASFCLVVANALLVSSLAIKAQEHAIAGTLILLPLYVKMLSLCKKIGAMKEDLLQKSIQQVVQQSMVHIAFGLAVLVSAI